MAVIIRDQTYKCTFGEGFVTNVIARKWTRYENGNLDKTRT